MPWKMKDANIETDASGNPVWIDTAGKEAGIAGETLTRVNGEARQHRLDKEAAQKELAKFEGIDPVAARDALDKMVLIDQNKLVASDKLDELKTTMAKQYQTQIDTNKAEIAKLTGDLKAEKINNKFATSPFIKDKLIVPGDMAAKLFGDRFDLDKDGQVIAKDANGNPMISGKNSGAIADFEEAFGTIFDQFTGKDTLMRGANNSGTGNTGGGGGSGASKTLTRSQEKALTQPERSAFMKEVREGKAQLVDDK